MFDKLTVERSMILSIIASIALAAVLALSIDQEVHAAPLDLYAKNLRCVDTSPGSGFQMSVRGTIYYVQSGTGFEVGIANATVSLTANGMTRTGTTDYKGNFDIDVPAGFVSLISISVTTDSKDNYVGPTSFNCIPIGYGCDTGDGSRIQGVAAESSCSSVGGIADLPDVKALSQESSQSSGNHVPPFAIGGAASAALIVISTAWILRRRRSTG